MKAMTECRSCLFDPLCRGGNKQWAEMCVLIAAEAAKSRSRCWIGDPVSTHTAGMNSLRTGMLLDCVLGSETGREHQAWGVDGSLEEFMLYTVAVLSGDSSFIYIAQSHNILFDYLLNVGYFWYKISHMIVLEILFMISDHISVWFWFCSLF